MSHTAADAAPKKRRVPAWLELLVLIAIAVTIAVVVKSFFLQMFFVPSTSMKPLFVKDVRILVQKMSYWNGDVKRGDVIVFNDPQGKWLGENDQPLNVVQRGLAAIGLYPTGGHLVKRVIGIGGDHVVCCDSQGRITVNDVPLSETDFILNGTKPSDIKFSVEVPKDHLWVMGDNRDNSEDSRYHRTLDHGTVPVSDVVGKVWAIVWPANRIKRVHTPATFDNPTLLTSSAAGPR